MVPSVIGIELIVGSYFIDEEGYETGQIIAEISDGAIIWPSSIALKGMRRDLLPNFPPVIS